MLQDSVCHILQYNEEPVLLCQPEWVLIFWGIKGQN